MKTAKIIASVVALLLALSWLATLAQAAGKFVVGYAAMNSRMAPLWLAEEQGYFAKYGMEPQAVFLRSATVLVTGLAFGRYSRWHGRRQRRFGGRQQRP